MMRPPLQIDTDIDKDKSEFSPLTQSIVPENLAAEFGLSSHFTKRLALELGKRELVSTPDFVSGETRRLLSMCSGLFKGTSTKSLGVYYLGDRDSSQEQFLADANSHFSMIKRVLGNDVMKFFKREIYYKQKIGETPYYLIVRRGFLENNWGMELAIGTEDANWQRTENFEDNKDLARLGINFDANGIRIVNVEGVEHAKKPINKHMPKTLKHKPLNLLILLVAMWANEQGFEKIRGIRNSHQQYLEDRLEATGESFSYEKIFSAVGMSPENDAWMGIEASDFYTLLLANLSPAQADGFNDIATAFDNLIPLNKDGAATESDTPFSLRHDMAVIGPLMDTTRYCIHEHVPGFGPVKTPKRHSAK